MKVQVFDPPVCCCSGGCGPNADPKVARFGEDLDWLAKQGITVERFNQTSHSGVFSQEATVKQALEEDINCLPLILVDGSIVHKGGYPSRTELIEACQIGTGPEGIEETNSSPQGAAACGPGCDCGASPGAGKAKSAISLVALVAVVGILGYKTMGGGTGQSGASPCCPGGGISCGPAAGAASAGQEEFDVSQVNAAVAPASVAPAASEASGEEITGEPVARDAGSVEKAADATKPDVAVPAATEDSAFGESLASLSDLNEVAMDQDSVFILIPAKGETAASDSTRSAALAAKKTMASKDITVGMYTLRTDSADYPAISSQVQTPAILVACKGRSMAAVSGEVTEEKLLQAFMSSSRAAGGCCPGGAGASGCGPR